jgi:sporadic carbohydrate cluster 2OG-Fe(II) oxygenase
MNDVFKEVFNGAGYVVTPIENMSVFNILRESLLKKLGNDVNFKDITSLRKSMLNMTNSQINHLMLKLLSFSEASELMVQSCRGLVEALCGKEIFLQRRANTIFNIPGKDQRRQWPHYEMMSGISPFTYVFWAPFHDLDDDGGVFYINQKKSLEIIKKEHSLGLVNGPTIFEMKYDERPKKLKYGEVLVFNPFILHGNVNFESKLSRIACSIRLQSTKKPIMQRNSDFYKYYEIN